jgi:hypothetical protein
MASVCQWRHRGQGQILLIRRNGVGAIESTTNAGSSGEVHFVALAPNGAVPNTVRGVGRQALTNPTAAAVIRRLTPLGSPAGQIRERPMFWHADRRRSRIGAVARRSASWSPWGAGSQARIVVGLAHPRLTIPRWDRLRPRSRYSMGRAARPSHRGHDEYPAVAPDRGGRSGFRAAQCPRGRRGR